VRRGSNDSRAQPRAVAPPVGESVTETAELRSEQRLGFTARRAAVLSAVVCVLTLTVAGPVRTYFAQRTEMKQLTAIKATLHQQIDELQDQKAKLADPSYVAAQARERLGFVKPGEIPYQVQVPATAESPQEPDAGPRLNFGQGPWYSALWHTIADDPHGPAPAPAPPPPPSPAPPGG
jgi:cell division protein FtsB